MTRRPPRPQTSPRRGCCAEVIASNSARPFRSPAPIVTSAAAEILIRSASRAIEYGAGCLRNARYLQKRRLQVTVVEYPELQGRFPREYRLFLERGGRFVPFRATAVSSDGGRGYDLAVMTYVLETICRPELRLQLLRDCRRRLHSSGALLLSVRGIADVVTAHARGRACSDGFLTPHRTFIRAFTCRDLEVLVQRAGFDDLAFLHRPETDSPELIHVIARP
jgi:hypothetical protein